MIKIFVQYIVHNNAVNEHTLYAFPLLCSNWRHCNHSNTGINNRRSSRVREREK